MKITPLNKNIRINNRIKNYTNKKLIMFTNNKIQKYLNYKDKINF